MIAVGAPPSERGGAEKKRAAASRFKRTDLGTIPSDWEWKSLGDLASVTAGGTPSRLVSAFWNGDIAWITSSQIDFSTIDTADQFISERGLKYSSAKLFRPRTLLIALYGNTRGKVAMLEISAAANQACAAILPRNCDLSFYLFYYLASQYETIRRLSNTGNQDNLSGTIVRSIQIRLPPLREQSGIVATLSDADNLIRALNNLILKKLAVKRATMQQLLTGKTRLPEFPKDSGYKRTKYGIIPADWRTSVVGKEFKVQLGKKLDAAKNSGVSKPYLGNRAVQWGRFDLTDLPMMPLTPSDLQQFRLRPGDVLVCEGGEIGRAALWDAPIPECYYQMALHRLRPTSGYDPLFMLYLLQLWTSNGHLQDYVARTSIAHLPKDKFELVPLPVPPKPEQRAIAAVLSDMDAEIVALERRRDKTRAIKQGMMQALLTGRVRLPPAAAAPGAGP
jgi:type I restriction enzyme S subunit